MAKELPYFKFEPGQWDNGKIQMCSFEAQGIFINICSMYWQRLGDLPYKLALQKVCNGNATALQSLCDEGVIKVIDDMICLDFLNEQLSEFGNVSKINSENARSGWEKRKNNATAKQPHSERNAIREEKRREDEKREEKNNIAAGEPASLNQRLFEFEKKVEKYMDVYPKEMVSAFFDYWTERNEGGRRMRFEMQKVFDIKKRLVTWSNNDKKNYGSGKQINKHQQHTASLVKNFAETYGAVFTSGPDGQGNGPTADHD